MTKFKASKYPISFSAATLVKSKRGLLAAVDLAQPSEDSPVFLTAMKLEAGEPISPREAQMLREAALAKLPNEEYARMVLQDSHLPRKPALTDF